MKLRLLCAVLPWALSGCGYIHFGRLPQATAVGDPAASAAYSNLSTEQKILKQELALARKEGDALRAALDRGGSGSPELVTQLNETSRELATLRASYAKLQAERSAAPGDPATAQRQSETEERLAASLRNYTQLQEENSRLRVDLARARAENTTLAEQVKSATSQHEQAQAALAQLNTELLAQKAARDNADQATAAARAQLSAVMAARPEPAPVATTPSSPALSALQLARAPPADAPATAELRTSAERIQAAASPAPPTPETPKRRMHVVAAGDTLEKIAQKYYGAPERWTRIYTANGEQLRDGQALKPGMELEIPE